MYRIAASQYMVTLLVRLPAGESQRIGEQDGIDLLPNRVYRYQRETRQLKA